MKRNASIACATVLVLAACERPEKATVVPTKSDPVERPAGRADRGPQSPIRAMAGLHSRPAGEQAAALADLIHRVPDEDLGPALGPVLATVDPGLKRSLLVAIYEETDVRPAVVRLPLLLELARQPECAPGLRTTILAQLRTTLGADYGSSWGDWALALDEHLGETWGLIRVEE